ncbi:hypothetical protein [Fluviicola chungangensis]|uniref:Uncharacterized protein n=1 Tax=Fluviicola chungangensis TaxID=2597671 RepID=A0A556MYE5_9FLAO|nr:hypothetical protein [Fluviicola chungangensis]TSJ44940.1 hypothetical protein FO442_10105 [Fluviicola chungangensis]
MINKKGKRKIVFEGETYYWFVKKESEADFLSIGSEDKSTLILYHINQINDEFIHPKIAVLQSEKMSPGAYSFFPPLSDESISGSTVRAILNWYFIQVR